MIRANFNSHVWDANFLPDGEGTQWYIDWSMLWSEHQHMDRVPVGELTPELIHAFDAVLQVTHGTPSHHNDCVVANVMQPLGWASQTIVGTGRLRIPSPPQSQFAHSLTAHAYSRLDRASNQVSTLNTQITRHSILNQDRLTASLPTQARQAAARQSQKQEAIEDGVRAAQYIHRIDPGKLDYAATSIETYLRRALKKFIPPTSMKLFQGGVTLQFFFLKIISKI